MSFTCIWSTPTRNWNSWKNGIAMHFKSISVFLQYHSIISWYLDSTIIDDSSLACLLCIGLLATMAGRPCSESPHIYFHFYFHPWHFWELHCACNFEHRYILLIFLNSLTFKLNLILILKLDIFSFLFVFWIIIIAIIITF